MGYFLLLSLSVHALGVLLPVMPVATIQVAATELRITTASSAAPIHRRVRTTTGTAPAVSETEQHNRAEADGLAPPTDSAANHLQGLLLEAIARHFVYPPVARRNGWEGKAEVLIHLDHTGRLRVVRLARSSGYAVLDQDAVLTLQKIGSIPTAYHWLHGHSYNARLPVLYKLTEG